MYSLPPHSGHRPQATGPSFFQRPRPRPAHEGCAPTAPLPGTLFGLFTWLPLPVVLAQTSLLGEASLSLWRRCPPTAPHTTVSVHPRALLFPSCLTDGVLCVTSVSPVPLRAGTVPDWSTSWPQLQDGAQQVLRKYLRDERMTSPRHLQLLGLTEEQTAGSKEQVSVLHEKVTGKPLPPNLPHT